MFNAYTTTAKMGPRTFIEQALASFLAPRPVEVQVRSAEEVQKLREATINRPTERRISEYVLKDYTVEKMADKMFNLSLKIEAAHRAGKHDEAKALLKKGEHYETIAEAKELIEPGFKTKVEELVKAKIVGITRGRKGTIHRMNAAVVHGLDGSATNVAEQPEPVMDTELRDAFSQVADPALVEALNALSQTAQQGGQSTL